MRRSVSRASRVDSDEVVDEVDDGDEGVGDDDDDVVVVGEAGDEAAGERVGGSGEWAAGRVGVDGHDRVWSVGAKIFPVNLIIKIPGKKPTKRISRYLLRARPRYQRRSAGIGEEDGGVPRSLVGPCCS